MMAAGANRPTSTNLARQVTPFSGVSATPAPLHSGSKLKNQLKPTSARIEFCIRSQTSDDPSTFVSRSRII
jgi:hypothetical protein